MTIREPVQRALDIGTGCGVQALFLARHAEHVIGTDVNPRALWLAACNAALNGITNVEWREGSLFEPVAGETFDQIIANPPFVQSPDATYIFRDGGTDDNICGRMLRKMPVHLEQGGFAQALISWVVGADGDWEAGPYSWIAGMGCDAWLLHYQSEDGLAYAAKWNAWLAGDAEAFAATLDRWTAHYAANGIASLATGAITLRRRHTGDAWWLTSEMIEGPSGAAGRQIQRVFSARDALMSMDDAALMASIPRFCGGHRLDQRMRFRDGSYAVEATEIVPDESVGVRVPVGADALLIILGIDGETRLGDLVAEASEGLDPKEARALEDAGLQAVRALGEMGVVEVVSGES